MLCVTTLKQPSIPKNRCHFTHFPSFCVKPRLKVHELCRNTVSLPQKSFICPKKPQYIIHNGSEIFDLFHSIPDSSASKFKMAAKATHSKTEDETNLEFNLPEKVKKYEDFINNNLKEDLRKVHEQRDQLHSTIADYLQLKSTIDRIKIFNEGKMRTQVDLGCNFYCQAEVKDTKMILVAVGYGFFVEFTLDEAVKFIDKKVEHLTKQAEGLAKDSAKIKAHIKVALQGLTELQMLNFVDNK